MTSDLLRTISSTLDTVDKAGMTAVLRFAYNFSGGKNDGNLNQILSHIDQVKPILQVSKYRCYIDIKGTWY